MSVLTEHEAALVAEVNNLFFIDMEITVDFKMRGGGRCAGVSRGGRRGVGVVAGVSHYGSMLDTLFHELGHMHHYWYNREDYNKCTDYGHEVYAEGFGCVVLPGSGGGLGGGGCGRGCACGGGCRCSGGLCAVRVGSVWVGCVFAVSVLFGGVSRNRQSLTRLKRTLYESWVLTYKIILV